ncbi:uncharacterized protein G2W53_037698 [Senna tora]|uniref:Uncharacterized protein n=1 Tax=Senna tora TaxID=362788 RepID=A0A834W192_9FABA|nr:uncharacterized protein G2W53_037698 [Senna tora]
MNPAAKIDPIESNLAQVIITKAKRKEAESIAASLSQRSPEQDSDDRKKEKDDAAQRRRYEKEVPVAYSREVALVISSAMSSATGTKASPTIGFH